MKEIKKAVRVRTVVNALKAGKAIPAEATPEQVDFANQVIQAEKIVSDFIKENGTKAMLVERLRDHYIGEIVKSGNTVNIQAVRGKPYGTIVALPTKDNNIVCGISYLSAEDKNSSFPILGVSIALKRALEDRETGKVLQEYINGIFDYSEIEAGKITVIKGESGVGKSTLLKLIAGLNRPTVGEIFINDLPMSKTDRQSLLEKIAYVPQQPHRFRASFVDNAALFDDVNPSTLKKFAAEIGLTVENHDLSRGQLQRLGLLRALIKIDRGASIVILDEPTAGLDLETERLIIDLIKKIGRRRTIVIAAHRPTVIESADRIIDLDS